MAHTTPTLLHVISYCEAPQSDWQGSVPPDTPPSSRFTVAPWLTWQIWPGSLAKQPELDASLSVATLGG